METIGFLELNSIAKGMEVADCVLKTAEVKLVFSRAGCPGKYYLLFTGEVAAVQESIDAGCRLGGQFVVDHCVIPRVHPQVISAIHSATMLDNMRAIGVMEFFSVTASVYAADAAAKAADVQLLDVRLGTGIGGGIVINGHVHRGKDLSAGELSYFFADTLTRKDVDKIFDIDSISDMEEEYEKLPYLWSTSYSTRAFCYQVAVAKGINPKEFNGELLYKMAEEGDPVVLDMLEDFYFTTAKYLFNIFAIVDPDIILLGGGISAQPAFVEGVKRYVEKLKSISMITNFIKVDVCKFGNDSNLLGALYSFRQMYLEN